jgi:hypothetical protein
MNDQIQEDIQRWPKSYKEAHKRALVFKSLKSIVHTKPSELEVFQTYEQTLLELHPILREPTETEKEGYSQVMFQGNPWSSLNSIPFALLFLSIYKTYIVPGATILLPIITLFLPYLLLKTMYNIPIQFGEYTKILWRLWNGKALPTKPEDFLNAVDTEPIDTITVLKKLAQNSWTLVTLGQAIWIPIQQARHFRKLDVECEGFGEKICRIRDIGIGLHERWKEYFPSWFSVWIELCPNTSRQAFAFFQEYPYWFYHTKRAIQRFHILYKLARRPDVTPVTFVDSKTPILMLKEFGDPNIAYEDRVLSSIKSKGHTIVTGPNRGGKSSFLRGILQSIQFAHAYGAVYAKKAEMSYFTWIADGLKLEDRPGKTSMFEREVEFATNVLNKNDGKGIVFYDELFHSTNPPDAERTSRIFCRDLWKKKNCLSFISTHVYGLAKDAPKEVQTLCLASWKTREDEYIFSYGIQKGICTVSSVDLLLQEHGWNLYADKMSCAEAEGNKKACIRQE